MANEEKSYGWLGVDMPMDVKIRMALLQRAIDPEDLYTDKAGFGLDKNPHVTLAYGHEEEDPETTRQAIEDIGAGEGRLSSLSTFDNPNYKVLKFDVDSPHLHALNRRVRERIAMPGLTFKDYNPHVTVAYLKPDTDIEKYRQLERLLSNRRFPVKMVRFSNPRNEYRTLLLKEVLKKSAFDVKEDKRLEAVRKIVREQKGLNKVAKIILDINVGDTVLVGRFKNKPIEVKDIGTDANGQPTINGRKLLSLRIAKLMPKKKKAATVSAASKKMRKGKNTSKAALKMRKQASAEEVEYKIVSGKKRYKPVDGETKEYAIRRAIAKINGLHAGSAKIVRTSDDDNVFESLNVVDDHRNKGIGRELADRLLKDADKRGAKSITLRANPYMDEPVDKEKLIEFYKTLGFESTDDDGRMIRKKASTLVDSLELEKVAEEVEHINTGLDILNNTIRKLEGK